MEGGVRVPSIWYWPGKITPGSIDSSITSVVDILPTICSISNVPIPTDRIIDGIDISNILFDNSPGTRECMVYFSQKFLTAVRCGDYKLHYMTKESGVGGIPITQDPPLLFNVRTNPRENLPLTAESFPLYNQVIDGLNAYKANFVENLVLVLLNLNYIIKQLVHINHVVIQIQHLHVIVLLQEWKKIL